MAELIHIDHEDASEGSDPAAITPGDAWDSVNNAAVECRAEAALNSSDFGLYVPSASRRFARIEIDGLAAWNKGDVRRIGMRFNLNSRSGTNGDNFWIMHGIYDAATDHLRMLCLDIEQVTSTTFKIRAGHKPDTKSATAGLADPGDYTAFSSTFTNSEDVRVELEVKRATAGNTDGYLKLWCQGTLVESKENLDFEMDHATDGDREVDRLMFGRERSTGEGSALQLTDLYIDDVVIRDDSVSIYDAGGDDVEMGGAATFDVASTISAPTLLVYEATSGNYEKRVEAGGSITTDPAAGIVGAAGLRVEQTAANTGEVYVEKRWPTDGDFKLYVAVDPNGIVLPDNAKHKIVSMRNHVTDTEVAYIAMQWDAGGGGWEFVFHFDDDAGSKTFTTPTITDSGPFELEFWFNRGASVEVGARVFKHSLHTWTGVALTDGGPVPNATIFRFGVNGTAENTVGNVFFIDEATLDDDPSATIGPLIVEGDVKNLGALLVGTEFAATLSHSVEHGMSLTIETLSDVGCEANFEKIAAAAIEAATGVAPTPNVVRSFLGAFASMATVTAQPNRDVSFEAVLDGALAVAPQFNVERSFVLAAASVAQVMSTIVGAELFLDFEAGGKTGADAFDATSETGGTITREAAAGLGGTANGITVHKSGTTGSPHGQIAAASRPTWDADTDFRLAFSFDPNGRNAASSDYQLRVQSDENADMQVIVKFPMSGSAYTVQFDVEGMTSPAAAALTDGKNDIEYWLEPTGVSGRFNFHGYVNGAEVATVNDFAYGGSYTNQLRFGAPFDDSTNQALGTFYIDRIGVNITGNRILSGEVPFTLAVAATNNVAAQLNRDASFEMALELASTILPDLLRQANLSATISSTASVGAQENVDRSFVATVNATATLAAVENVLRSFALSIGVESAFQALVTKDMVQVSGLTVTWEIPGDERNWQIPGVTGTFIPDED